MKIKNGNTIKEINSSLFEIYSLLGWVKADDTEISKDEVNLLKVKYSRVIGTTTVTLNDSNYQELGFKKGGDSSSGYYYYLIDESTGQEVKYTETEVEEKKYYEYILPNPSSLTPTYSDVDKEGSGRNENDGLMVRERIGHYQSLDVTWNIVPNSQERIDLVKILKSLPPSFTLVYYDNDSKDEKEMLCYHGDIKDDLYIFLKDNQIWKSLTVSFIQFDITPYDDSTDPEDSLVIIKNIAKN